MRKDNDKANQLQQDKFGFEYDDHNKPEEVLEEV